MTQTLPLAGQVALITGAWGGIGSGSAKELLLDGASVMLMARSKDKLILAKKDLERFKTKGAQIEIFAGDACNEEVIQDALKRAKDIKGRLDIVVAVVGGSAIRPLLLTDLSQFTNIVNYNLAPVFLIARYATPLMDRERGGSIVCISSTAAMKAIPNLAPYCTGKAALESFVKVAANELAPFKIRINSVRPGTVRSEATRFMFENKEMLKGASERNPLNRLGEPVDIGKAVRYFAGPESSWVTGASFAVSGGSESREEDLFSSVCEQMYGKEAMEAARKGVGMKTKSFI